ncbi:MAG: SMC-Scp complex subunit ScpB, partial [Gammaproteobacteria bacterium]|nr:SMC-Scp complex subunit ScpB [Gammaproteobacteria bacterium]
MDAEGIERVIEAVLLAADEPVSIDRMLRLFAPGELPDDNPRGAVRTALDAIGEATAERGFELVRVASGFRFQVRQQYSPWVSRLLDERPPRYSRALLETLALIVYRQPVTRGDIEEIRGVSVSQSIMRTLLERGWIRVVGQRETPGRPALYGTTRTFLDYFNLTSLDDLPPMDEIESLMKPVLDDAEAADEGGRSPQRGGAGGLPPEEKSPQRGGGGGGAPPQKNQTPPPHPPPRPPTAPPKKNPPPPPPPP